VTQKDDRLNPGTDAELPFEAGVASRRTILFVALGLLAGCAESKLRAAMPGPAWPNNRVALELPKTVTPASEPAMAGGIIRRGAWAKAQPVPSLMNRMLPVRHITVHHTAMHFTDSSQGATAAMMERIRLGHRDRNFGDIGYHFAVDRAGRVWEGRPLSWQGAHVANRNEGNLGIVALGNFDEQSPSNAQVDALRRFLSQAMRTYNVPVSRVKTHQEWAPTRCPGTQMQRYIMNMRSNGGLG
jgi:hypothetical protein